MSHRARGRLIRTVYALCLLGATFNHIRAIADHGWLPEHLPLGSAIYSTSLTFIDPLVAALLFLRPRLGIASTAVVIGTNVPHNLLLTAAYVAPGEFLNVVLSSFMLVGQIVFLVFVVLTAPTAWRDAGDGNS